MPVKSQEFGELINETHNLIRLICAEEHEPRVQFCGYISILMGLFKDVKGYKNVMMQQVHRKARIRHLREAMDVGVRKFRENRSALFDKHDCVDWADRTVIEPVPGVFRR